MEPFPFLVGFERSGTTLLRAIVDSHPEIAVPPEAPFVAALAAERGRYERRDGFARERFLDDLVAAERLWRWPMTEHDARRALVDAAPADYAGAIRGLFSAWARREGKPRYGDKTPRNVLALDALADVFPEARFVHLLRDGRDVAASYAQEFGLPVPRAIRRWRRRVRIARSAGEALGRSRYLEVGYEALVSDPETTVRSVCDFVELGFDPAMLRHHERAEHLLAAIPGRAHHATVQLPITAGLRDWRTQMTPDDIGLCELLGGDLLQDLGYDLSGVEPSLRARARLMGLDAGVRARRARRLAPAALRRVGARIRP